MKETNLPKALSVDAVIGELGSVPRPEHPRPDRLRSDWLNLNGVWEFCFDPEDTGLTSGWSDGRALEQEIVVPFCPESELSGIHDEGLHTVCWYARSFDLPEKLHKRLLLHFGAVDYRCNVWLNGHHLGSHEGGYDSFAFDISPIVKLTGNRLTVRVHDDPHESKPHGKQAVKPEGCVYMRTTGIWQTVWLEAVGSTYLRDWVVRASSGGYLECQGMIDGPETDLKVNAVLSRDATKVAACDVEPRDGKFTFSLAVKDALPWSPESPILYDLDLALLKPNETELDRVRTYVGFRTIEVKDGECWLNGHPFFVVSALDQGYYPDGLYTAPSDAALRSDVEWARRYGLNSIRKHQIVAEPRFYYWCDRLGMTLWGEMADWGAGIEGEEYLAQWKACLTRDINHPCIITWVPTNERGATQGTGASAAIVRAYELTKALDPTRPVIDNSGFYHTQTDIVDLHEYPAGEDWRSWWQAWKLSMAETGTFKAEFGPVFAEGFPYAGQPVIISETGNWWIRAFPPAGAWQPYGNGPVDTVDDFIALYRMFFLALMKEPDCAGFSYVQLYDVEGEVNGYLTYDRRPKIAPEIIADIHAEGLRLRE
jgi:beta-galactosidase/beta-glucuronidase